MADDKELKEQLSKLLKKVQEELIRLSEERYRLAHTSTTAFNTEDGKTHYQRIAEALLSSDNKPRAASWLASMTGLPRSAVSQVLHRTHRQAFESQPMPGYTKKLLWSLTGDASVEAMRRKQTPEQPYLFEGAGEFDGVKAVDCCQVILAERGNEPTSALTLAREALRRGYHARVKGLADEVLLTTAKSFWAALGRDFRFTEVRPLVFALKDDTYLDQPDENATWEE